MNYYPGYIPKRFQRNKTVLREAEVLETALDEKGCLLRSAKIYGEMFDYSRSYHQKEIFLSDHRNILFLGHSGAIVEKNNNVVAESAFDEIRLLKSPAFRLPAIMRSSTKKGVFTSILHLPWAEENIYHWFIDCLPRLLSIQKIPLDEPIGLIVNKGIKPYQLETLQFFLEKDKRLSLHFIGKDEKWRIERFWLPSFISNHLSGYLPSDYMAYVKNTIREGYQQQPGLHKRKLFISRRHALKRRISNEDVLSAFLVKNGFEIVFAEKLPYKEQVAFFAEADWVISGHGAGLTNLLFADNVKVVEIQPVDIVKSHYCLLSLACKHEYFSFLGSDSDKAGNYSVDMESFETFFYSLCRESVNVL